MNDQELKSKLSGCYGEDDKIFAGHPNDRERAQQLLREMLDSKVTAKQLERVARELYAEWGLDNEAQNNRTFGLKNISNWLEMV